MCCAFTEESADKSKNEYKNKSTHVNIRMIKHEKKYKNQSMECKIHKAGHEINFFPDSHLAPEFFKVVANSKLLAIFKDKQNLFSPLSAF